MSFLIFFVFHLILVTSLLFHSQMNKICIKKRNIYKYINKKLSNTILDGGMNLKKKKDVSKQTVVVLVFLVILVSILGTFTVLQEAGQLTNARAQGDSQQPNNVGRASITIVNPADLQDTEVGRASITIVN